MSEEPDEPDTFICPVCGGNDDDAQLMCEACGGAGLLGEFQPDADERATIERAEAG